MKQKKQLSRELKHQITLLQKVKNKWIETDKIMANVQDMIKNNYRLFENIDFSSAISKNYYSITRRYYSNITIENRIKFKDNIYLILKIMNQNERNQILQILVSEI